MKYLSLIFKRIYEDDVAIILKVGMKKASMKLFNFYDKSCNEGDGVRVFTSSLRNNAFQLKRQKMINIFEVDEDESHSEGAIRG